jgi:hypothetical protein
MACARSTTSIWYHWNAKKDGSRGHDREQNKSKDEAGRFPAAIGFLQFPNAIQ